MSSPCEELARHLAAELGRVVFGMERTLHGMALALVAGGHVLLEGVPGIGKTLLAKSLAAQLSGRFKRVQCTADLMPSDITGIHVYHAEEHGFVLMPGPLFADVVLVDEINRTGPKTQSALLEAMEEASVTIDRKTYPLPEDFLVIASQNPHELEGTYPLPESQLDRFLIRLEMSYPDAEMEGLVLRTYDTVGGGHSQAAQPHEPLPAALRGACRAQVAEIRVSDALYDYVVRIGAASRTHPRISLGLSTRGVLALIRCARVEAGLEGESYVAPDHVKAVAVPVMAHRLILTPEASLEDVRPAEVVEEILAAVEVPRG